MSTTPPDDITRLLEAAQNGSRDAFDEVFPLVYVELRRMAAASLRRERADHTLDPTALVNEAYLKLVQQRTSGWKDRRQFFGVAAKAMRRILVDHARGRIAAKRAGDRTTAPVDGVVDRLEEQIADLVALDEALTDLAGIDPRKSSVVELRFFVGLTAAETAEVMGVPLRTVTRDWTLARAWLHARISEE